MVAVTLPRSVEQVVAIHAVIKSGAAYLPINPDDPADRIEHILGTAAPSIVLVAADQQAPETTATVLHVGLDDTSDVDHRAITDADRRAPLRPEHPAYVIFTSGSTGKPKGVTVSHRAITNRLQWMQHEYHIDQNDRVIQKTPATFDVSVWEFFWPLVAARISSCPPLTDIGIRGTCATSCRHMP